MINLSKEQKEKLFAQFRSSKNQCQLAIEDDQQRYQDSWLYFRKLRPANIDPSKKVLDTVIPVLQDCVTVLTPQILDIFTENDNQAVIFRDLGFKPNPILTSLINATINKTILRENDGYRIIENAIKDALISGNAFIKFYIEENYEKDKLILTAFTSFDDVVEELKQEEWTVDLPEGLLDSSPSGEYKGMQWQTRMTQPDFNPDGSMSEPQQIKEVMGKIPIQKLERKPILRNIGMQDLIFDITCGEEFDRCRFICHKNTLTIGEAVAMGYPLEKLETASTINRLGEASYSKINLVTGNQINAEDDPNLDVIDPMERRITLDEAYLYSSIPNDGKKTKQYQIIATDTEILDVVEIDGHPFVNFQMEVIPDSFFGASLYDRCKMYQDSLSTMVRLGIKQNIKAVYNKHIAAKGMYDRAALEADEPNAIIEIEAGGSVQPYVPPQLDQSYPTILDYLTQSMKNTIGTTVGNISTEDGLPANTAAATVSMILANEGLKSKVVAKTLARTGLVPLMRAVYKVMKQVGLVIQLPTGETTSADQWPDTYDFIIDINTQRDEMSEKEQITSAMNVVSNLAQVTTQAAVAGVIISPMNIYNLGMKLGGTEIDMSPFLSNPAQQQQNPEDQRQQQFKQYATEEMAKLQIDEQRAKNAKIAAEINKLEAEVDELIQNGAAKREVEFDNSLATITKHRNDAADKATKNAINNKAVDAEIKMNSIKQDNDTIEQAQTMRHAEHQHIIDITTPTITTGKKGVPNGVRQ